MKYYIYPWRYFYRHKVRMIEKQIREQRFNSILDFGSGPGLMRNEWEKHAKEVILFDKESENDVYFPPVSIAICASIMEFVNLKYTFEKLANSTKEIIVASPMQNRLSKLYFKLIGDKNMRHSNQEIMDEMIKHFYIKHYESWMGLYFCAYGVKR